MQPFIITVRVLHRTETLLPVQLVASFSSFYPKMKRTLCVFAVALCFALGQSLSCYKCAIGFGNLCITTQTSCSSGQQCFSGVGKAAGFVDIKQKGCLQVSECNQTTSMNFPSSSSNSTLYSITKTCCNTDLCNSAPGVPVTSGLSLALAALSALFAAKLMV